MEIYKSGIFHRHMIGLPESIRPIKIRGKWFFAGAVWNGLIARTFDGKTCCCGVDLKYTNVVVLQISAWTKSRIKWSDIASPHHQKSKTKTQASCNQLKPTCLYLPGLIHRKKKGSIHSINQPSFVNYIRPYPHILSFRCYQWPAVKNGPRTGTRYQISATCGTSAAAGANLHPSRSPRASLDFKRWAKTTNREMGWLRLNLQDVTKNPGNSRLVKHVCAYVSEYL